MSTEDDRTPVEVHANPFRLLYGEAQAWSTQEGAQQAQAASRSPSLEGLGAQALEEGCACVSFLSLFPNLLETSWIWTTGSSSAFETRTDAFWESFSLTPLDDLMIGFFSAFSSLLNSRHAPWAVKPQPRVPSLPQSVPCPLP